MARFFAVIVWLLVWLASAQAEVATFQNGVAPEPAYKGCTDTRIAEGKAEQRDNSKANTFSIRGETNRILIRFDLSALPKDQEVAKALLRVYATALTDSAATLTCMRVTQDWEETANWTQTKIVPKPPPAVPGKEGEAPKSTESDWKTPGGTLDLETDFGKGGKGIIDTSEVKSGPFGQMFELDVTALVAKIASGAQPNQGFCLQAGKLPVSVASAEWAMEGYRPQLQVEYYPKGHAPAQTVLHPWVNSPKDAAMHSVAQTGDTGNTSGQTATERWGLGTSCQHQDFFDTYIRESPAYPGRWGWMTALVAGGNAGDFSRILLRVDLKTVPAKTSIQSAKLHLCLTNAKGGPGRHMAAFLVNSEWSPEEVTSAESKAGQPWPKGGIVAATENQPVAMSVEKPAAKPEELSWLEWDLTGAVRAWVQGKLPNNGVLIDNRLENGSFMAYSSRDAHLERRPYLEITLNPGTNAPGKTVAAPEPLVPPTGDYWVEPMKKIHARFKGKPGTLGQYGDSITVTMAFLAPHAWGASIAPDKGPPEFLKQLEELQGYAQFALWKKWKGGGNGNDGGTTVSWFHQHVDRWQKAMLPEVAVILFGTNDTNQGPQPPAYTETMAACVERLLADGTIPILTTLPPRSAQKQDPKTLERILAIRQAQILIAQTQQIPLIDFYQEIMTRQPENWDKILIGDGVHPSMTKPYEKDFTEEGLKNSGYTLRNYLTLQMYYEVFKKVLKP